MMKFESGCDLKLAVIWVSFVSNCCSFLNYKTIFSFTKNFNNVDVKCQVSFFNIDIMEIMSITAQSMECGFYGVAWKGDI